MQNALLNVPAHDFDEYVIDRRSRKNIVTEVRDNSRNRDHYEEETPRNNYQEPAYHEPEPVREPEHDYTQKPEGVPDYTEPVEPVYHEPEPVRDPEPIYIEPIREPEPVYIEPAPPVDNAPSFDDELSKGQN